MYNDLSLIFLSQTDFIFKHFMIKTPFKRHLYSYAYIQLLVDILTYYCFLIVLIYFWTPHLFIFKFFSYLLTCSWPVVGYSFWMQPGTYHPLPIELLFLNILLPKHHFLGLLPPTYWYAPAVGYSSRMQPGTYHSLPIELIFLNIS